MNRHINFGLFTALALAGCTPPPPMTPLTTPTGKPEVLIMGKTQQEVVNGVAESCALKGSVVESQTASMVVCSGIVDDFATRVQIGYQYGNGQIIAKCQFVVSPVSNGQRVMVSNMWYEVNRDQGGVYRVPVAFDRGPIGQAAMGMMGRIKVNITGGK